MQSRWSGKNDRENTQTNMSIYIGYYAMDNGSMVPCPYVQIGTDKQVKSKQVIVMKNKIFYAIAIAVALFTGYSAYNAHNQQELSDVFHPSK